MEQRGSSMPPVAEAWRSSIPALPSSGYDNSLGRREQRP